MKMNLRQIASIVGCAVLLAGCATQQQQQGNYTNKPAETPAAAPEPAKPGTVTAYFPSGRVEGSGLMIEKSAPAEVLVGQPYEYTYKVSNLTDATLENVTVGDRVGSDFTATDSDPKAASMSGGNATWTLGTLGPKESRTITVRGSSPDEGMVTTCGWAAYTPVVCQDIRVVKANIALTKTEPADELICNPIPVTLTVKNTGSSTLTSVRIADTLPAGLVANNDQSSLTFDAGNLAPGETKEFKYDAAASRTGRFENEATVTTAEGVSAKVSATTVVHQPVLAITCKAADQQFMGRKFDVSYTVSNTGDAPAAGTKLEVAVPAGLEVASAGNGQVSGGKVDWDLGSVEANAPQTVTATFTGAKAGTFEFAGTAKGDCAAQVSTRCETRVIGIAAILLEKSDNPDPVTIGETTTYTVKVTNQGSANDSNIHVTVTVDKELVPVSSSEGTINGQVVDFPVVPTLAPKAAVTYTIVAKGVKAGGAVTQFKLSSDLLSSPITAEESTTVY